MFGAQWEESKSGSTKRRIMAVDRSVGGGEDSIPPDFCPGMPLFLSVICDTTDSSPIKSQLFQEFNWYHAIESEHRPSVHFVTDFKRLIHGF
jgi:hypothetical protein